MDVIRKNEVYTVSITGYSSEGLGVARVDGQVLFVHGRALPARSATYW